MFRGEFLFESQEHVLSVLGLGQERKPDSEEFNLFS